jgi:hypothetical protein
MTLDNEDLYTYRCGHCGKGVPDGESMWTVNVHEEVVSGDSIEVLDAETVQVYCGDCRGLFDLGRVQIPRAGALPGPA